MTMVEAFARLRALMSAHDEKEIADYIRATGIVPEELASALAAIGITWGGVNRGVLAATPMVFQPPPGSPEEAAATAFALAFARGEADALRRVKIALSSTKARGRELDVVDRLMAGSNVIDALTAPAGAEERERSAVVVPLRPRGTERVQA